MTPEFLSSLEWDAAIRRRTTEIAALEPQLHTLDLSARTLEPQLHTLDLSARRV